MTTGLTIYEHFSRKLKIKRKVSLVLISFRVTVLGKRESNEASCCFMASFQSFYVFFIFSAKFLKLFFYHQNCFSPFHSFSFYLSPFTVCHLPFPVFCWSFFIHHLSFALRHLPCVLFICHHFLSVLCRSPSPFGVRVT